MDWGVWLRHWRMSELTYTPLVVYTYYYKVVMSTARSVGLQKEVSGRHLCLMPGQWAGVGQTPLFKARQLAMQAL